MLFSLLAMLLPLYDMPTAEMQNGHLLFAEPNGLATSIRSGFFQLKIPEDLRDDITLADQFATLLFLPKKDDATPLNHFRGFVQLERDFGFHGYKSDEENQVERFDLEQEDWSVFPDEIQRVVRKMNNLGIQILTDVLQKLEIPEHHWVDLTGGSIKNRGLHVAMWNHFRSDIPARGLKNHKDWGNVTVLRSQFPGLEAKIDGKWYRISPLGPDYFVINFGMALEMATRYTSHPVTASEHRVVRQEKVAGQLDRTSYALFVDNRTDIRFYDPQTETTVVVYPNIEEYTHAASKITYEGIGEE